jgi:hypothetical protein
MDAQISKALMGVFMKATQVEAAVTDLILAANATCSSESSEEKQLSDLFEFLGITYDAGKAKTMGGTPCFNGPEGVCQRLFQVRAYKLPVDTICLEMISFQHVAAGFCISLCIHACFLQHSGLSRSQEAVSDWFDGHWNFPQHRGKQMGWPCGCSSNNRHSGGWCGSAIRIWQ